MTLVLRKGRMHMKKKISVRELVTAAMMAALVTVLTMFISIKIPGINGGYIHLGDSMIYAAAYLLGGPWGAVIGGLGSMLADLFAGYASYAPATLVIKAAMGFLVGAVSARYAGKALPRIVASVGAGLLMTVGYFVYELALYGYAAAAAGIAFNLLQAVGGVIIAEPIIRILQRISRSISLR